MKTQDFIREPCSCGECQQAGVSALEQRRDPWTGKWLHGYDLKRWYQAKDTVREKFNAMISGKGMR